MFEQLSGAQERYQAINDRLMDPNVVSDPKQYAELMKEYKNLTPIVEKYCEYKKATEDMEEAKMMLEEGGLDKDFRELIEEQYETSKKDIEVISEQLKILLIPKDPNDDQERYRGNPRRCRRRRGCPVCKQPVPYVLDVCRKPGMEDRGAQRQPDRAGRLQGNQLLNQRRRRLLQIQV